MESIMTPGRRTEIIERNILKKYAAFSADSKGRKHSEDICPFRTCFQRDRDRILHSNSFRRLKHKTQVFLSPHGDHYRTRLTHTLEVSQIARTVARILGLNEDLTEAIALGHDLGHTPFGHAGERVLNKICPHGFKHYMQSVRVVDVIENGGKGLNLTFEVCDGIQNHSGTGKSATLEGRIVNISDKIAYVNHDIEDAVRAGIISNGDLPEECVEVLGKTKNERITSVIASISMESTASDGNICGNDIAISKIILDAHMRLRQFMYDRVYLNHEAKQEEKKAEELISSLYAYYVKNAECLPDKYREISRKEDEHRGVCDYIAGMTDRFAVSKYMELFIPKGW